MTTACTAAECSGRVIAKGLCSKHYNRVRRRGSFADGKTCQAPPEERFWRFVDKADGCWLWNGGKQKQGYGTFGDGHKVVYAHRFSWALHFGPVPAGLGVLHHCDTPACVNPNHLFVGTHLDNMRDMYAKGRRRARNQHG